MKLFDYLRLGINERINYKTESGKEIREIYEEEFSDKAKEYEGREWMGPEEITQLFGFCNPIFHQHRRLGRFGEALRTVEKRHERTYYSTSRVLKEYKKERTFIPTSEFLKVLGEYYYSDSGTGFRDLCHENGIEISRKGLRPADASRIIRKLKERKKAFDELKTFDDLYEDLEGKVDLRTLMSYYEREIRDGKIKVVKGMRDGRRELRGGNNYRISPKDYGRMLEEQRMRAEGITPTELARALGVDYHRITRRVKKIGMITTPFKGPRYKLLTLDQAITIIDDINEKQRVKLCAGIDDRELMKTWIRYKTKNEPELRAELIEHYMPVLRETAIKQHGKLAGHVDLGILESDGLLGLMNAIESADLSRIGSFKAYCATKIRGAILDEVRVRDRAVGRTARTLERVFNETRQRLEKEQGRRVWEYEVDEELGSTGIDWKKLRCMRTKAKTIRTFNEPRKGGDDMEGPHALDEMPGFREEEPHVTPMREDLLRRIIEGMNRKERAVITLYYYEGLGMKEIGEVLNLTLSRVCQIHGEVISRMRQNSKLTELLSA